MIETINFDFLNVPDNLSNMVLCLGFFDGIHIGHQQFIKNAVNTGKSVGVLTFDEPPSYVLGKTNSKKCLTSVDDKAEYLENLGVKYLLVLSFDYDCTNLSKDQFILLILKKLNPDTIFVGESYTFGKDGAGNPEYLKQFFNVQIVKTIKTENEKVSSRIIRSLIEEGKVEKANQLLGHSYRIGGYVISGEHKGRTIGFPTANLDPDFPYVLPKIGVYTGYAYFQGYKKKCLISVGTHPTFIELNAPIIEVHIIDYNGVLYGDYVFIEYVERIRDMFKFDSIEMLVEQLNKDKEYAISTLQ